jgi:hypothetical protein
MKRMKALEDENRHLKNVLEENFKAEMVKEALEKKH